MSGVRRIPQMPLVIDDALITSDDRHYVIHGPWRGCEENNQVLVFTHHRHLLEVWARRQSGARVCRAYVVRVDGRSAGRAEYDRRACES